MTFTNLFKIFNTSNMDVHKGPSSVRLLAIIAIIFITTPIAVLADDSTLNINQTGTDACDRFAACVRAENVSDGPAKSMCSQECYKLHMNNVAVGTYDSDSHLRTCEEAAFGAVANASMPFEEMYASVCVGQVQQACGAELGAAFSNFAAFERVCGEAIEDLERVGADWSGANDTLCTPECDTSLYNHVDLLRAATECLAAQVDNNPGLLIPIERVLFAGESVREPRAYLRSVYAAVTSNYEAVCNVVPRLPGVPNTVNVSSATKTYTTTMLFVIAGMVTFFGAIVWE